MYGLDIWAYTIMSKSLWISTLAASGVVCSLWTLEVLWGIPALKQIMWVGSVITWPVLILWGTVTVLQSSSRLSTIFIMLCCGTLGVISLDHPAVRGHSQMITALLSGVFAIPILWLSFWQSNKKGRVRYSGLKPHPIEGRFKQLGPLIGLFAVAIPGLSASSAVSVFARTTSDEGEYLTLTSTAEGSGELFGLALALIGIAYRSSDAALLDQALRLGSITYQPNPQFPYLIGLTLLGSVWVGNNVVGWISPLYRWLVHAIPMKIQSLVVGTAGLWVVWEHTGVPGLLVVLVGTLIHLGGRMMGVPNQAFFACMIVPMAVTSLGIDFWASP
jgi:TctA family transporter